VRFAESASAWTYDFPMPTPPPPVLGLTGGIASGKSTVARILRDEGCVVADSDELARQAYNDPEIRAQLLAWWGDRVRECHSCHAPPDGMPPPIDRRAVAEIVFASPAERARLPAPGPWSSTPPSCTKPG
jgi:dephospho-CoA kinase